MLLRLHAGEDMNCEQGHLGEERRESSFAHSMTCRQWWADLATTVCIALELWTTPVQIYDSLQFHRSTLHTDLSTFLSK